MRSALRVLGKIGRDRISLAAAGVAFYGLLAVFPAIAALVSIYGLAADPADLEGLAASLTGFVPDEALKILQGALHAVIDAPDAKLGWGLALGLALTHWSSASGVKTLMTALNIVHDQPETRGILKYNAVALSLTAGAILGVAVALGLIVVLPAVLGYLSWIGMSRVLTIVLSVVHWPILAGLVALGLSALYRYGPSRPAAADRHWLTPGAAVATLLWLIASIAFSLYVAHLGNYDKTYGSLGAVVILLMWFYISAYILLLGAEIDAEVERRSQARAPELPPPEALAGG